MRSAAASVLAAKLHRAAQEERYLCKQLRETRSSNSTSATYSGVDGGDGVGLDHPSPVLELLLRSYPRDMAAPQLIGLSASPVVNFEKKEEKLLELLLIVRCRLVGIVDEMDNLHRQRPDPAITALSYLPLHEERVLHTALRQALVHVFRRMVALVPDGPMRKKFDILRSTCVASPAFAVYCSQFETDTVLAQGFKNVLRIPPHSILATDVQTFMAEAATEKGSSVGDRSRTAISFPVTLTREQEQNVCVDFILFGLRFLKTINSALIALQDESYDEMMRLFYNDFSPEEVQRIAYVCWPITTLVLRPVLKSVVMLMRSLRLQHPDLCLAATSSPTAARDTTSALSHPPPRVYTIEDAQQASHGLLPRALQGYSTRTQVLVRLFAELAVVAVTMGSAQVGGTGQHLRVLVFVEARDTAVSLMKVLPDGCPFVYNVLRPEVLPGQKTNGGSGKKLHDTCGVDGGAGQVSRRRDPARLRHHSCRGGHRSAGLPRCDPQPPAHGAAEYRAVLRPAPHEKYLFPLLDRLTERTPPAGFCGECHLRCREDASEHC
jgi:hypothetical protein